MITHVAIRFEGKIWHLPAPNRHHNVIALIYKETGKSVDVDFNNDQGFLDDALPYDPAIAPGRFLTRPQARHRAVLYGQMKGEIKGAFCSENLW